MVAAMPAPQHGWYAAGCEPDISMIRPNRKGARDSESRPYSAMLAPTTTVPARLRRERVIAPLNLAVVLAFMTYELDHDGPIAISPG